MPIEQHNISDDVNATVTFYSSQTNVAPDSWGVNKQEPDLSSGVVIRVNIVPFKALRRLAFAEAMGGSQDIRLYWVCTEFPMVVKDDDEFVLTENGDVVRYVVQMMDQAIYTEDTTLCICKRMV